MTINACIRTTLFDLFKVGPGPSSSHTIGPMRAGHDFANLCGTLPEETFNRAARVRVRLFGSLSATGIGHGTDAAVVAGLMGIAPESCPAGLLQNIMNEPHTQHPSVIRELPVCPDIVVHDSIIHDYPYSNTLIIDLQDAAGQILLDREYYSVGGGFIQWKGWEAPELGEPAHRYCNMTELRAIAKEKGMNIYEIMLDNEMAITGTERRTIIDLLNEVLEHMEQGVRRGLDAEGFLPGPLGVQRKARMLLQHSSRLQATHDRFLTQLNAYAYATAEENASGGVIVTAPTCGAAGVMPALVYSMRHDLAIGDRAIREGFLAAAAVGFLAKNNASIAGAEVGCQGEVGVASAMAAAMLADARGNSAMFTENAAEVALEHHLGITCDPVMGYVQIPCIERNAMGAIKAYNAAVITTGTDPRSQRVTLDAAIAAMAETGREMNTKFKETSLGGLAVSMVAC